MVVDGQGIPLGSHTASASPAEIRLLEEVISDIRIPKKGPGRPRKYDSDAERKKAYRERKKEELQKLESRAKRILELKGRIDNMEKKLVKSTYTDKKIPEATH